jgi:hypothetical protein
MREIVHIQAGQCGNQIGAKVKHLSIFKILWLFLTDVLKDRYFNFNTGNFFWELAIWTSLFLACQLGQVVNSF